MTNRLHRLLPVSLIAAGTVCSLAATDLVLPAIPMLPSVLEGSAAEAQWVLAAFALGTGFGLLLFGELGARYPIAGVLIAALIVFSALSVAATLAPSLTGMSVIRFFQGIAAAAPAVFAPVMINRLYAADAAVAMIGRIGSIESMAPAIAPIIGAALLSAFGWRSTFYVVAAVAAVLAFAWRAWPGTSQQFEQIARIDDGYLSLLTRAPFLRYSLSQACTLGALLVVVFSAPTIIVAGLGGTLTDFIIMQVAGITFFVIAANMTGTFIRWWGPERAIFIGSALSAAGTAAILLLALTGNDSVALLWFAFLFVNLGLGIRGPVGFYRALLAAGANESRGSALVVFLVMIVTALGTAIVAPFIETGLLPMAIVATLISGLSVILLAALPALDDA